MRHSLDTRGSPAGAREWWRDAVFYRISPRSFADSNGDGIGDLNGIRERMGYLELLGIDGIWLTGVVRAPVGDQGGSREVDPLIGGLDALERLIAEAHRRGIRVAIDISVSRRGAGFHDDLGETVRFWLDRGIDGFRVCSAPGALAPADEFVHEIVRLTRRVADEYQGRVVSALVDGDWYDRLGSADELNLGIDFRFGPTGFDAARLREVIDLVHADARSLNVEPAWGRVAPDQFRPIRDYGRGATGLARDRAVTLVRFALPGVVGLEYGEELGLHEADLPGLVGGDPIHTLMPWEGRHPPFGFSTAPGSWQPMTEEWASLTVESQFEDPASTLSLYRRAMDLRKRCPALRTDGVEWLSAPARCFAFRRAHGGTSLVCALNTGTKPTSMPPGDVVLASGPLSGGGLPPDTAVWLLPTAGDGSKS